MNAGEIPFKPTKTAHMITFLILAIIITAVVIFLVFLIIGQVFPLIWRGIRLDRDDPASALPSVTGQISSSSLFLAYPECSCDREVVPDRWCEWR
jgi:hypothetical protein